MRNRLPALIISLLFLCSCAMPSNHSLPQRREAGFLTLFDTVTSIVGYAETEAEFAEAVEQIQRELETYHQLFDIYNDYPGINNIKTINDRAGGDPIPVDRRIVDLLLFCREIAEITEGRVDVTMGSVLSLWHEAREYGVEYPEEAFLPSMEALWEAERHTGFHLVEIDEERCTVRLLDPEARLDVGAVAKGYAAEQVTNNAPPGMLISVGGNITATGAKPNGDPWTVGVEDPDGGSYLEKISLSAGAVVTSGDYQRYYTVEGIRYHHIIDPETLMPGNKWRAVTILCDDSGLADGLSTALFLMDRAEGQLLLDQTGACAMWVATDGTQYYSDGFLNAVKP